MSFDEGLLAWVQEAMEPAGRVTMRRMMGGATLYLDGPISLHGATPVSLEHLVRAAIEPLLSMTPHDLVAGDWAV